LIGDGRLRLLSSLSLSSLRFDIGEFFVSFRADNDDGSDFLLNGFARCSSDDDFSSSESRFFLIFCGGFVRSNFVLRNGDLSSSESDFFLMLCEGFELSNLALRTGGLSSSESCLFLVICGEFVRFGLLLRIGDLSSSSSSSESCLRFIFDGESERSNLVLREGDFSIGGKRLFVLVKSSESLLRRTVRSNAPVFNGLNSSSFERRLVRFNDVDCVGRNFPFAIVCV
jgi:hypothetical protein